MDDESYINSVREGLKESVEFFASQDKFIRERWVVSEFLKNLSIPYAENEIARGPDPPDVIFREAQFEVKEILDKDRKRHAEYKEALVRANVANDPSQLLEGYSPKTISIEEVYALVHSEAADLARQKYSLDVRRQLDLLFYVNLQDVMHMTEFPFPDVSALAQLGYRSVSFLEGYRSCVFCAALGVPKFLLVQSGVVHRVEP
jgi:hypothetical protein